MAETDRGERHGGKEEEIEIGGKKMKEEREKGVIDKASEN